MGDLERHKRESCMKKEQQNSMRCLRENLTLNYLVLVYLMEGSWKAPPRGNGHLRRQLPFALSLSRLSSSLLPFPSGPSHDDLLFLDDLPLQEIQGEILTIYRRS
jgi:hypothetical protein